MAHQTKDTPRCKHPLYLTWKNLKQRCNNPNNPKYYRYGGRGINICDRWSDFSNFLADMGDKPSYDKYKNTYMPIWTIGRIDNNRGYSKENCRWELASQQSRNRSSNTVMIYKGKKYYISDLLTRYGVSRGAYYSRVYSGWGRIAAATTPVRKGNYKGNPR